MAGRSQRVRPRLGGGVCAHGINAAVVCIRPEAAAQRGAHAACCAAQPLRCMLPCYAASSARAAGAGGVPGLHGVLVTESRTAGVAAGAGCRMWGTRAAGVWAVPCRLLPMQRRFPVSTGVDSIDAEVWAEDLHLQQGHRARCVAVAGPGNAHIGAAGAHSCSRVRPDLCRAQVLGSPPQLERTSSM